MIGRQTLYRLGVGGALVSAFLAGSVLLGPVFAQNPAATAQPDPSAQASPTAQTAPVPQGGTFREPREQREAPGQKEQAEPSEQAQQAALQAQAKVSLDQAKQAALAQVPGGTVRYAELDNEHGTLVYDIKVVDSAGAVHDVHVDATSGSVATSKVEQPEKGEAAEAPEAAEGD